VSLPAPYYQDDAVTIYHGDCREILPALEVCALALTDPPYNLGISYGERTSGLPHD
jgi:DNA modification methylase